MDAIDGAATLSTAYIVVGICAMTTASVSLLVGVWVAVLAIRRLIEISERAVSAWESLAASWSGYMGRLPGEALPRISDDNDKR